LSILAPDNVENIVYGLKISLLVRSETSLAL